MKISIIVNEVFDGWSPDSKRLGGTEESVVWWAKILKKRGHEVAVFHNGEHGTWDGVVYAPREQYVDGDVCLNIKSLDIAPKVPTIYFTNETDIAEKDVSAFAAVAVPSEWARLNLGIRHGKILVIPHGYDPETIKVGKKVPKQVLYCSSPDRGLATLLNAWPDVVKYHPDAILIVTYGFKNEQHRNIPNLIALGEVDGGTMGELYQSSDIWAHPANGGELYCMAAVKAQVAGCVPVYFPTMALQETVRHGISTHSAVFMSDLVSILGNEPRKDEIRREMAEEEYPDWEASTKALESALREISQQNT